MGKSLQAAAISSMKFSGSLQVKQTRGKVTLVLMIHSAAGWRGLHCDERITKIEGLKASL
jgi:hypothetical protein